MGPIIVVNLARNVRSVFTEIISTQIEGIRKRKSVDLSLNTEASSTDSPLVAEIKKQLKAAEEGNVARLGTIGADLIDSSRVVTENLVNEAKALRKKANDQLSKARNIHNAQQHMLNTGDSLPLAYYLDLIHSSADIKLVEKHIEQVGIKDYFGEKNPKKASD